ncbi:hypothetical protein [Methylobacterium gregans]
MADTLSYALAIAHTRRWSVGAALAIQIGSFGAYLTHFTGYRVGTGLGVLAMTVAVIVICSRMLELRHLRQGVRSFGIGGRVGEGRPVVERI